MGSGPELVLVWAKLREIFCFLVPALEWELTGRLKLDRPRAVRGCDRILQAAAGPKSGRLLAVLLLPRRALYLVA
jgi:hypothetical protein